MTYQEAIWEFEDVIEVPSLLNSEKDACRMAMKALEKQIPMKIKHDGWLYCPRCGKQLNIDRANYCKFCGQALKQED